MNWPFFFHQHVFSSLIGDRLVDIVNATGKGYIVWQEIIDHHVKVNPDTLVEVWKVEAVCCILSSCYSQIFKGASRSRTGPSDKPRIPSYPLSVLVSVTFVVHRKHLRLLEVSQFGYIRARLVQVLQM